MNCMSQHAIKTNRALAINTMSDDIQTGTSFGRFFAELRNAKRGGILMNLKRCLHALCCIALSSILGLNAAEMPQEPISLFNSISSELFPGEIAGLIQSNEYMMAWKVLNNSSQLSVDAYKDFLRRNPDGKSETIYKEPIPRLRFLLAYIKWLEVEVQTKYKKVNDDLIKDLLFGKKKGEKRNNTGAYNFALEVFARYPASDTALAAGELCQKISEFVKSRYNMELNPNKGGRDEVVRRLHQNKPTKGLSDIIATIASESQGKMISEKNQFAEYLALRDKLALEKTVVALQKRAEGMRDSTFELKGFYLGMPIADAKKLVEYYLPGVKAVITKDNNLAIDKPEELFDSTLYWMYFCQADKSGRVYRFNFDKRFLKKWCRYDVQTHEEWAEAFGREHGCDFRYNKVEKNRDMGAILPLTVKQDSYRYLNNLKDYKITYFGKKEVFDPTNGQAADAGDVGFAAGAGGFAGGMPDNFQIQAEAMRLTGQRIGVHSWIQHGYENGDGAKEGTLRVELLND